MLRRHLLGSLLIAVAVASLASVASAEAFNPKTQSHWGACSRTTTNVKQAVRDFAANGVLADFAHLIDIYPPPSRLEKTMDRRLVVGRVHQKVVTANHGCDGEGEWFAVGPRTLNKGEKVGVKVSRKLRSKLCLKGHSGCRRIVLKVAVVFPINCWNPNMGPVKVALYVHRHKKKKPKHKVQPAKEEVAPTPEPEPEPEPEPPAPTPDPAATAAQQTCGEGGGVVVTLSNGTSATASASFLLNETGHGPIAPGASEQVTIALGYGESKTITVKSGETVLIDAKSFTNACGVAKPAARASVVSACYSRESESGSGEEYGGLYKFELANIQGATLAASFKIEWSGQNGKVEVEEFGPLAPGETIEPEPEILIGYPSFTPFPEEKEIPSFYRVSSGGELLLNVPEVEFPC